MEKTLLEKQFVWCHFVKVDYDIITSYDSINKMAQHIHILIQSSFYYSGNGDYITPFHFNIRLQEWEVSDVEL